MDEQFKKWHDKLMQELTISNLSFAQLYNVLLQMKENNVDKQFAYAVLEYTRERGKGTLTEKQEDLILELMDVVTGFCSPNNRIWE
jgi:hypothetical protein